MDNLVKKFYSDYIEFENFIEFRMFDLSKKVNGKNPMISKYATSLDEVQYIIDNYSGDNYIVYVSCNPRIQRGRTDSAVKTRRTLFFDIEMDGDKPPLSNKVYYNKLMKTALYIWKELKKLGIEPNLLMESGRGLHLGIKFMPLGVKAFNKRFKLWYKQIIKDLMKNRPYSEIKFDDSMINLSRIESAPGFCHNKYPEKPRRKILKLFLHKNNMLILLNRVTFKKNKMSKFNSKYKKRYTENTFYESPEWTLLSQHSDLPEGRIHTHIILQLKILARDNDIDKGKLQMRLSELGYNEVVDTPDEEYQYSEWVMFSWCMNNAKYCLERGIKPPNPFKGYTMRIVLKINIPLEVKKYPVVELNKFKDILRYIRAFNKNFAYYKGDKLAVYQDVLWKKINKGCDNEYLLKYIDFLNLKDYISTLFTSLNSEGVPEWKRRRNKKIADNWS